MHVLTQRSDSAPNASLATSSGYLNLSGEPIDENSPLESPMDGAFGGGGGGGGGMDVASPAGRFGTRESPPLTPVQVGAAAGGGAEAAGPRWGAAHPTATWRGVPESPAAPSQPTVKRKRTPVEGTDECTALAAYEEVSRTCCHARAPPGPSAHMSNLFWVMPYDQQAREPQLVAAIERYVLPNRNLRHTVFNDAGFLARVVHVQTPMQGVSSEEGGGVGGLVLVTPVGAEGYLRLTWPTRLIGPTLDELLSRSQPCVVPTLALEGRHDCDDDHEEELGKRMRSSLTLASPHAAQAQQQAAAAGGQYPMGMGGETESDADAEDSSMSCSQGDPM
jgi:hypothetical protein